MKNSKYNVFFNYENKMIGYNSLSDNFVIMEPMIYELYNAAIQENKINEITKYHDDFSETLKTNGFIIDESIDELQVVKDISYEHDFNESDYSLTINPTMSCNFKCWYCYESHVKGSKMNKETVNKINNFVDNLILSKKGKLTNFNLQWFGGEPLMYFNKVILPILEYIYPKMITNRINFSSGITTNGYYINQKVLDECKRLRLNHFQITLDGNKERHDKVRFVSETVGSYDKTIKNIKLCLKNELNVSARINISEETIPNLLSIIDDFNDITENDKKFLVFSFHEVWQEEKDLDSDISSFVKTFREKGFSCSYKGETTASITSSCYADKLNQATINYNGEIFKCTARDFNSNSKEGDLLEDGTIKWNEKFQKRIFDTRFKNKPCLECKILPVCNGGCSQHRIENEGEDYCIYNFDESKKTDIIKEKFISRLYAQ